MNVVQRVPNSTTRTYPFGNPVSIVRLHELERDLNIRDVVLVIEELAAMVQDDYRFDNWQISKSPNTYKAIAKAASEPLENVYRLIRRIRGKACKEIWRGVRCQT